jgi:hypothetical protein
MKSQKQNNSSRTSKIELSKSENRIKTTLIELKHETRKQNRSELPLISQLRNFGLVIFTACEFIYLSFALFLLLWSPKFGKLLCQL